MQAVADTPISSHRADASYATASPPPKKISSFQSYVEQDRNVQPGDVSTKRQKMEFISADKAVELTEC